MSASSVCFWLFLWHGAAVRFLPGIIYVSDQVDVKLSPPLPLLASLHSFLFPCIRAHLLSFRCFTPFCRFEQGDIAKGFVKRCVAKFSVNQAVNLLSRGHPSPQSRSSLRRRCSLGKRRRLAFTCSGFRNELRDILVRSSARPFVYDLLRAIASVSTFVYRRLIA